jgi:hypothetical protein
MMSDNTLGSYLIAPAHYVETIFGLPISAAALLSTRWKNISIYTNLRLKKQ